MDNKQGLSAIHLFAGAGGGLLGGILRGWRTVCAVEIDQFCREVLVARQNDGTIPPFPIWDDVRTFDGIPFRGRVDIVAGGFPCFVAGTLVLTETGYVPIEQVRVGDLVLTHRGNWRKVTAVMCKQGADTVVVSGFGMLPTECTPNHRFYSYNAGTVDWTSAEKLGRQHELSVTLPAEEDGGHTAEWWYLCGRYLADGWLVRRKGRKYGRTIICCNDDKLKQLVAAVDAAGYHATIVRDGTVNKLHITRGDLYRDLLQFGRGAAGKRVPRAALCLDREKAKALITGYLDGDGSITPEGYRRANSVSPSLALGMQLVSVRAGMSMPGIYHTARKKTCTIQGRTCSQRDTYTLQWTNRSGNRTRWRLDGNTVWRKCYGTEQVDGTKTVYNLSVDGDESYVVNGTAVHNCQNVSPLGDRTGIRGDKSGLWKEFARIVGEVRPVWVFVENSSDLIRLGLDVVLHDLDTLGYDAEWTCMSAAELGARHIRDRLWLLAKARGSGNACCTSEAGGRREVLSGGGSSSEGVRVLPDSYVQRREEQGYAVTAAAGVHPAELQGADEERRVRQLSWWAHEPDVDRVAHGMANQLEQLRALGNGQVPAVAAAAFEILMHRFTCC